MAATHFLVLPTTGEVFRWRVIETKTNQIISRRRNLRLVLDKAGRLNIEAALLRGIRDCGGAYATPGERKQFSELGIEEVPRCGYQDDRHELPRDAPATVTDIETGCTFCASHFQEAIL